MRNKIVVAGGDHHNTLGVVESFGMKGLKSYVVLYTPWSEGYVLHSKWVEDGWCCSDEQKFVECLTANFTDKENKAVLISTNDIVASIIDKYAQILSDFFFLQTTQPTGTLLDWMGKEKMSETAREVGMNVPKTWIISGNEIPFGIEYPVITKAISSVAGSKANIRICKTEADLRAFLKEEHCSTIQVQRFIDKDFEFQFIGCSINGGEAVLIPGRTHIDRPNGLDNTFFLSFDKCEEEMSPLVQKAVKFIKQTKYTGPFSMEFLRDKNDGKDYFTEMNFRNDGNAICATWGGVNLPYILYMSEIGGDWEGEYARSELRKVYLCPDVHYFIRLLAREFGFKEWLRNMRRTDCFTTYFKNDPKPFRWFLWLAIKKRIFRRFI